MKFKFFLLLGISTIVVGKAYLWSHNSSFSQEKDKIVFDISSYFTIEHSPT